MASNVYYGIDLGTGNCSIAWIAESPRARQQPPVPVEVFAFPRPDGTRSSRFPSVVAVPHGVRRLSAALFGSAAAEWRGKGERGHNLFYSTKSDMGTRTIYDEADLPELRTPVGVTAAFLVRMIQMVIEAGFPDPRESRTSITVPASFAGNQRKDTLDAAHCAGLSLEEGDLLDEPVAALLDLCNSPHLDAKISPIAPKTLLVFDFGAGTCDVAVLRVQYADPGSPLALKMETLAIGPYEKFGGDNLDWAVLERVVWPQVCARHGIDKDALPERLKRRFADANIWRIGRYLKEQMCLLLAEEGRRKGRTAAAKRISLSAHTVRAKPEPEMGWNEIPPARISMTREAFDEAVARFFAADAQAQLFLFADEYVETSVLRPVQDALEVAGIGPGDVDFVILNGGSCRNPLVRRAFEEWGFFAATQIVETPDLDASVARGAALQCFWLHARKRSLAAPIANEDLGIFSQEGTFFPLVTGGTPLPYPPSSQTPLPASGLVVPAPGLEELVIPIYAGSEGRRRVAEVGRVPLTGQVPSGTPVEVSVAVDANRISHWRFRILTLEPIEGEMTLGNPWVNRVTSPREREVERVSEEISVTFARTGKVPLELKVWQADALRRCGEVFRSKEIVEAVLGKDENNARAHNLMGLLWRALEKHDRELCSYSTAAQLQPDEPVYVGNRGAALVTLGRHAEGISELQRALQMNPELQYCYTWLGDAYQALGDTARAEKEFRQSIHLLARRIAGATRPRAEDCRELGNLQNRVGDHEEAERCFERATSLEQEEVFGADAASVVSSFDISRLLPESPP